MPETRHGPLHGLFDTFSELNRMREHWRDVEPTPHSRTHATAWVPTLEIYARGGDVVLRCELAGVDRDDVEVSLSRDQLVVWGERRGDPQEGDDVSYYVQGRRYGPFRRSVTLPDAIEADRVSASFVDGLLEIRIDGGVEPNHQRIDIAFADAGEVKLDVTREGP